MSAPDAPDAPAPPPAGKAKKTLLLALVVVLGIGLGGAGGVMMAGPLLAGGAAAPAPAAPGGDEDEADDEAAADTTAPAVVYMVENLVLNPAGTGGSRFLLLTIGLAVADDAGSKMLQARDPELRDVVIRQLGSRTVEELTDITRRDSLKAELKSALVERFGRKSVREVYFPQFVIQ